MNIKSLKIKNNFLGWEFDEITFSSNLTLLVGVSGVGKTQILQAIANLQDIVNGKSINGFEWSIKFTTNSNKEFLWQGAFSVVEDNIQDFAFRNLVGAKSWGNSNIIYERLEETAPNSLIIDRNSDAIIFNGENTPKLSSVESVIHILREEEIISEVVKAFEKIALKDYTSQNRNFYSTEQSVEELKKNYTSLENIKNSNENIKIKLFLIYELKLGEFEEIKNRFIEIFQQIEDIKIKELEMPETFFNRGTIAYISIKEKGVLKWIDEREMSSGMLRTIVHFSELLLSSDGSVILIDEFENSLGVNCIDTLTDDLIHENSQIQFIATSHHPYIINNIPYQYWKVVSRKGGKISVRQASDYQLGRSKQDAFIQLTKILENQSI
jgi:predicted ATPase